MVDPDRVFEVLADEHRRRLLFGLLGCNPQQDHINVPEDIHDGDRELEVLQAQLYHQHLPKLQNFGVIEWDEEAHQVAKGSKFDEIQPILEILDDNRDELPEGYL